MDAWETIAERRIQEAMETGAFDNLEGAGKPLNLEDGVFEGSDTWLGYHLLRNQGLTLPWMEELKELRAAKEELRQKIAAYLQRNQSAAWQESNSCSDLAARERISNSLSASIETVNRRIMTYNLKAPSVRFHIALLDPPRALAKTTQSGVPRNISVSPHH